MTNIYLTDSNEEAMVEFVKDHKELYNKTSEYFKDKVRSSSPRVASCLPRCAKLAKGMLWEAETVEVWTGPKGDERMLDLDTGQARIPKVAHQMQGAPQVVSLQIASLRGQSLGYYKHRQYGDKHGVNRHHVTASTSDGPQPSFRGLSSRPAGHGPVHIDEIHAVIIPQAKAWDNNTYSLLQLPGI